MTRKRDSQEVKDRVSKELQPSDKGHPQKHYGWVKKARKKEELVPKIIFLTIKSGETKIKQLYLKPMS